MLEVTALQRQAHPEVLEVQTLVAVAEELHTTLAQVLLVVQVS
jgi:hypothetical protein